LFTLINAVEDNLTFRLSSLISFYVYIWYNMCDKLMKRNFSEQMTKIIDERYNGNMVDNIDVCRKIIWEDPHTILMCFNRNVAKVDTR